MMKFNLTQTGALKLLAAGLVLSLLLAFTPLIVIAQEEGDVCVQHYQPGAGCTANDVRIEELVIKELVKPCGAEPDVGYMDVVFEVLVSADGSPDRYDIGLFLAKDGGSALSGNSCYHDYLEPPLTTTPVYGDYTNDGIPDIYDSSSPWWNGESNRPDDTCGDITSDTQVIRVTDVVRVACNDLDGNGAADISVCTSWDNNTGTTCSSVVQAVPGTVSKCSCATINFDFTPNAVEQISFSATSQTAPVYVYPVVFGLVLTASAVFGGFIRRRL